MGNHMVQLSLRINNDQFDYPCSQFNSPPFVLCKRHDNTRVKSPIDLLCPFHYFSIVQQIEQLGMATQAQCGNADLEKVFLWKRYEDAIGE
jgi:hypothetical protein